MRVLVLVYIYYAPLLSAITQLCAEFRSFTETPHGICKQFFWNPALRRAAPEIRSQVLQRLGKYTAPGACTQTRALRWLAELAQYTSISIINWVLSLWRKTCSCMWVTAAGASHAPWPKISSIIFDLAQCCVQALASADDFLHKLRQQLVTLRFAAVHTAAFCKKCDWI